MYSLSDPWFDFTSPEDQQMLRSIEQKQGNGLSGKELMIIFQSHCSAGTVQELKYYEPIVWKYLNSYLTKSYDEYVFDLWSNFIDWIFANKGEISDLNAYIKQIEIYVYKFLSLKYGEIDSFHINTCLRDDQLIFDLFDCRLIDNEFKKSLICYIVDNIDVFYMLILDIFLESRSKNCILFGDKELIDNYINLSIVKSAIDISINHVLLMQDMPCDLVSKIDESSLWLACT